MSQKSAVNGALGNSLILSKILSNLPLQDLRTSRLVNSLWMNQSSLHFYTLGYINMISKKILREDWSHFLRELRNHHNLQIMLDSHDIHSELNWEHNTRTKRASLEQLLDLYPSYCSSIKSLQIVFRMAIRTLTPIELEETRKFFRLLNKMKQLEELEMIFLWTDSTEGFWPADLYPLFSVKKLKLLIYSCTEMDDTEITESNRKFFRKLVKATPNLEHLCMHFNGSTYLEEMVKLQKEEKDEVGLPSKNPTSLDLGQHGEFDKAFSFCLQLEQPLRSLMIRRMDKYTKEEVCTLVKLLKKNSNTLEYLSLSSIEGIGKGIGKGICLPDLPKLTKLHLGFDDVDEGHRQRKSKPKSQKKKKAKKEEPRKPLKDIFGIRKLLNRGSPRLMDGFPNLYSISFDLGIVSEKEALEAFLPKPNKNVNLCFKQITVIKCNCKVLSKDSKLNSLRKMFPNAIN